MREAFDAATDAMRDELRRRATEGYQETTFDADGKVLRRVGRMNPADLHLELKRRDPSYRDNNAQVQVAVASGQIRHERGLTLRDLVEWTAEHGLLPPKLPAAIASESEAVDGTWRALPQSTEEGESQ